MNGLLISSEQLAQQLGLTSGVLLILSSFLIALLIVLAIFLLILFVKLPQKLSALSELTKSTWRQDLSSALTQSQDLLVTKIKPEFLTSQLNFERAMDRLSRQDREELSKTLDSFRHTLSQSVEQSDRRVESFRSEQTQKMDALSQNMTKELSSIGQKVESSLKEMNQSNEAKLEKIRETVEDKLQSSLQAKLGESFKLVSNQLNEVYKGLGEMKELPSDVGGLKRVLVNVKSRGVLGEVQLEALLSQYFTESQYVKNAHPNSENPSKVVEFAVKLPGQAGQECLLPIDSKFPVEDFQRLAAAQDAGDRELVAKAREALKSRLINEAKSIAQYINPPQTTDFAVMFLPSEGLYAEALSLDGLTERLYSGSHVYILGPSTLASALCAYRAGFQTLAIEKRSSEIREVLGAVKAEYSRFGQIIDQLRKQLQTATRTVDQVETRTRVMNRKLQTVQENPDSPILQSLPTMEDE